MPGLLEAPTRYSPATCGSLMAGRNSASWLRPWDRPNAAPCCSAYLQRGEEQAAELSS